MEKSELKEKLAAHLKAALKQKDSRKISVMRLLLAEIHNQEIAKRQDATDADVLKVLSGSAKKHEDSISQFTAGNRPELAAAEREELEIIRTYLPEALSDVELGKLIDHVLAESGAQTAADFGRVMKILMPRLAGRASGQIVSEKLKTRLATTKYE